MKRVAYLMKLKKGFAAEYRARHDKIWPEMLENIRNAGVCDYSIFLDEETHTLFAVQTLADDRAADRSNNSVVRKWWDYMADIVETNGDNSPVKIPLQEVFHWDSETAENNRVPAPWGADFSRRPSEAAPKVSLAAPKVR
jgi:L-rhamnose mutarotase